MMISARVAPEKLITRSLPTINLWVIIKGLIMELTKEVFNELVLYSDGRLYWKPRDLKYCTNEHQMKAWNTRYANKEICQPIQNAGYRTFGLLGRRFLSHRAVWIMFYGEIDSEIDHINGDKLDNRVENLRQATSRQNKLNRRPSSGRSKYKGVYFNKKDKKWRAQATLNGNTKYLGNFNNEHDAAMAYNEFAKVHYDSFVVLNEV